LGIFFIPSFFSECWVQNTASSQTQPVINNTNQNLSVSSSSTVFRAKSFENPWKGFLPGTWVVRRTNSRQSEINTVLNNVTDTLLTLEAVDEHGMTLRQETAMAMVNGSYSSEPKTLYLDWLMQPISEGIKIEQLQPQTLLVSRWQITCQVLRYTQFVGDQKKTTTLWYSDAVMPYLLRLEEIRTNVPPTVEQQETVLSHTIMMVTDTSGVRLLKNLLSDYQTQTIKKTASGTVVSQASHSTNIPGGVLRDVTVERDASNKVVRRSVTSVIDYYVACPGVPLRQRHFDPEASKEIQSNWENLTILESD